jgi:hypothetical protein
VAGNLAIIAESQMLPRRSSASTDDLVLWDLSNPAAPRVVQKFTGVVKWLQDERHFTYVLNGDGLWVVSEPVETKPELTALGTYTAPLSIASSFKSVAEGTRCHPARTTRKLNYPFLAFLSFFISSFFMSSFFD